MFLQARRAESRARSETRDYSSFERARTPPFDPAVDPLNVSAFARYKQTLLDSSNALRSESARRQMDMASRRSAEVRRRNDDADSMDVVERLVNCFTMYLV